VNCAGKAGPCGVGDWVDVQTVYLIPGVVGVQFKQIHFFVELKQTTSNKI